MISKYIDEVTQQIMTGLELDKRRDPIKYKMEELIVKRILTRNIAWLMEEMNGPQKNTSGNNQKISVDSG
tara:strand:- start:52 stop:261 length:210 start_codon:yes stop_codon:yes gene_type:complete